MEKETNKLIAAHYQLFTINENGERNLVEETTQEQPFVFITGFGTALDAFEDILKNLGRGEKFDFELDKDKSFGEYDPKRVIELNKEMFTVDGHFDSKNIFKGAQIPLKNEDGNFFIAKVMEIGADKVKVDLNHPLAGRTLNFQGEIIESREASNDEMAAFVGQLSGQGSCGCGGNCGDGGCGCGGEGGGSCGCGGGDSCGCGGACKE